MFFLKDKYKVGYQYGTPTFYGTKHLGVDYLVPSGTPIYAPFNGTVVKNTFGNDGGYTTFFRPDGQDVTYRFLHLSKQPIPNGTHVTMGTVFAISGNTGLSTQPHIHFDAFKGMVLPPLVYTNFINPATIKWEIIMVPMETHVTLYQSNIVNPVLILSGLDLLKQKLHTVTNGEFKIITEILTTDAQFTATTFPNGQIQVNVNEILELDPKGAKVVCLVHTGVQPKPTNPFHNPQTKNGATPIQIPEYWYGEFPNVFMEFYLHELLHAWYYVINHLPYTEQIAKVHNPPPNWGGYGNSTDYYFSLILELKPYWSFLTSAGQKEPMIIINSTTDQTTKFALAQDQKVGFADFPAYQKYTAGRTVINLTLPDAEFVKIPTSQAVIKS